MDDGGDWRDLAACTGHDPDLWFPEGEEQVRHVDVYDIAPEAVEICGTCPVMQECRSTAIRQNEMGVWGGTGTAQRRIIRKALGLAGIGADEDEG